VRKERKDGYQRNNGGLYEAYHNLIINEGMTREEALIKIGEIRDDVSEWEKILELRRANGQANKQAVK